MFNPLIATATAAVLLASLAGCHQTTQQAKSADEMAQERTTLAERKAMESKEHFTSARAGVTTIQQRLAQQNWEAATDELLTLQRHLESVLASREVSNDVKGQIGGLFPAINSLRTQIKERSDKAATTAATLAKQFQATTDSLASMGWLGAEGGGAGINPNAVPRDDMDHTSPMHDQHD
jgi:hypothetical protein